MSYILNIYTNPATDYIIDPEPVANLVANKSLFQMLPLLNALLCLQSKTLPQVPGEPILHKNKKVSDFSETWFWAENETRTRDPNLGKVVLYQLSYFRNTNILKFYDYNLFDCECKGTTNFLFSKFFRNFF